MIKHTLFIYITIILFGVPHVSYAQELYIDSVSGVVEKQGRHYIYQGDMEVEIELVGYGSSFTPKFVKPGITLWPMGTVPFAFENCTTFSFDGTDFGCEDWTMAERTTVTTELNNISARLPRVNFVVRTSEARFLRVQKADFPRTTRGVAKLGASTRPHLTLNSDMTIQAADVDFEYTLRHEVGHVLGMSHEHSRPDSGLYIGIDVDVASELEVLSDVIPENRGEIFGAFERCSIMHYKLLSDSDGAPLFSDKMNPLVPTCTSFSGNDFTTDDIRKLSKLYGTEVDVGANCNPIPDKNTSFAFCF